MIDTDEYIKTHSEQEPPYLAKIARKAHLQLLNPRMLSGGLQGRLLKIFAAMLVPRKVLEIGTFVGYSTLCLAEGTPENAEIHTIEIDDELEEVIEENLAGVPHGKKVILHIGDALQVIDTLSDIIFDLVFIDGDKRQYLSYYNAVLPLLRSGGVILADNTLWGGKIFENVQRNDLQTNVMLQFNDFVAKDSRVEKILLPLRDGLTLIRKK